MYASTTSYHRGALIIDVRPGESHSAAWAAVSGAATQPRRHRHPDSVAGGARRAHACTARAPRSKRHRVMDLSR